MKSTKLRNITLTVIVVLMALSLTFLTPSGAILPEAAQRYLEETLPNWNNTGGARDTKLDGIVGYLANSGLIDAILPVNDVAYLPLDRNEPGRVPIEENFTETSYQDDTIIVEIAEERLYDSTFHVAYVKIATPTQLRTAVSGKSALNPSTLRPTEFSKNMHAIVLINGDYYAKWQNGYIVRQGEKLRWKPSNNVDILLIDENADFHIFLRGKADQEAAVNALLEEHEIVNGFFFGPALVVNGELQEIPKNYDFSPNYDEPRAAIGQLAPLTYVLVTVDGRIADSEGITTAELAAYMHDLGCTQAYALDGGNSSALVFHHMLVSVKDVHERDIPDVIYFATAIDN